jgi:hypothetical protein
MSGQEMRISLKGVQTKDLDKDTIEDDIRRQSGRLDLLETENRSLRSSLEILQIKSILDDTKIREYSNRLVKIELRNADILNRLKNVDLSQERLEKRCKVFADKVNKKFKVKGIGNVKDSNEIVKT